MFECVTYTDTVTTIFLQPEQAKGSKKGQKVKRTAVLQTTISLEEMKDKLKKVKLSLL